MILAALVAASSQVGKPRASGDDPGETTDPAPFMQ